MKIHLALISAVTLFSSIATADHGIVETTGEFNANGSNVYITQTDGNNDISNANWAGYDFGTFYVSNSDTLTFTNFFFENFAYNNTGNGGTDDGIDSTHTATLRILVNASTVGTYSLNRDSAVGNNDFWSTGGISLNLLDGLSSGTHTVSFEIDYTYDNFDSSSEITSVQSAINADSATANFTVVPEPQTFALISGVLGFVLVALRRRKL
jgi:hypothetical protein